MSKAVSILNAAIGFRNPLPWTIAICMCAALQLRADVTIRYENSVKLAAWFPTQAVPQALQGMLASSVRMKGGKAYSTNGGYIAFLLDFTKQELTFLDSEHSMFSRMPLADFPAMMTGLTPVPTPETTKALEGFKATFESKKTGATELIQGVQTEESEAVLSMQMPMPGGPQSPLVMKMIMRTWSAKPEEAIRNQAIGQLSSYQQWGKYISNPAGTLRSVLGSMPGLQDAFQSMAEAYSKFPVLRIQISMYLPLPPDALRKLAETNPSAGPIDPSAPLLEITSKAVELSSAPVDDSLFQIPPDYKTGDAREMLKGVIQKYTTPATPPATVTTATPPVNSAPAGGSVYRVGSGVSAPQLVSKVEPEYTEEARNAHIQGTSVLYIVVGADGVPRDMRVVVSLRPDLDRKAIEAVSSWRFKPGLKEGIPVPVAAQIEVNFRLRDNPTGLVR